MNYNGFLGMLKSSWGSYQKCRATLWWPFIFLLLAPIATLITIMFVPLILVKNNVLGFGLLTNKAFHLFLGLFVLSSAVPFLRGCTITILKHLKGERIDENTGFDSLNASLDTGIALFIALFIAFIITSLAGFALFLISYVPAISHYLFGASSIFNILTCMFILFLPAMLLNNDTTPYKAGLDTLIFIRLNLFHVIGVLAVLILGIILLIVPILIIKAVTFISSFLALLMGIAMVPVYIIALGRVLPFSVFFPVYAYKQLIKEQRINVMEQTVIN